MRSSRLPALLGAALTGLLLSAVAGAPAGAAQPKQCRVKNVTQDTWFATNSGAALTNALAASADGDRLNVFGRCRGSFGIDRSLFLYGTTNRQDPTVLDGTGTGRPVVGTAERATITLGRLVITGGDTTPTGTVGGGIQNGADLTLNDSFVVGNRSGLEGGGIFNYGELTLNRSVVSRNVAGGVGGGIFDEGGATLNRSWVTHNTASFGGGILSVNTLVLNHTVVRHNTPDDCPDC